LSAYLKESLNANKGLELNTSSDELFKKMIIALMKTVDEMKEFSEIQSAIARLEVLINELNKGLEVVESKTGLTSNMSIIIEKNKWAMHKVIPLIEKPKDAFIPKEIKQIISETFQCKTELKEEVKYNVKKLEAIEATTPKITKELPLNKFSYNTVPLNPKQSLKRYRILSESESIQGIIKTISNRILSALLELKNVKKRKAIKKVIHDRGNSLIFLDSKDSIFKPFSVFPVEKQSLNNNCEEFYSDRFHTSSGVKSSARAQRSSVVFFLSQYRFTNELKA